MRTRHSCLATSGIRAPRCRPTHEASTSIKSGMFPSRVRSANRARFDDVPPAKRCAAMRDQILWHPHDRQEIDALLQLADARLQSCNLQVTQ